MTKQQLRVLLVGMLFHGKMFKIPLFGTHFVSWVWHVKFSLVYHTFLSSQFRGEWWRFQMFHIFALPWIAVVTRVYRLQQPDAIIAISSNEFSEMNLVVRKMSSTIFSTSSSIKSPNFKYPLVLHLTKHVFWIYGKIFQFQVSPQFLFLTKHIF